MPSAPFAYDAIVLGGGPAGLVGALYLARFRRKVLVLDSGQTRAQRIPRSHNYPGFADGIAGCDLLEALRRQLSGYSVEPHPAEVTSLDALPGGFRAAWAAGEATARCVLVATGASDIAPDMPHLAEALREGAVRYCPVCDGFEAIDKNIGVLIGGEAGVREALYIRHFSDRVMVFKMADDFRLGEEDRRRLAEAGITVAPGVVQSVRAWEGRITVRHGDSEAVLDVVYSALGMRVHSTLAAGLGAKTDEAGYLLTDCHQQTTMPGLFAAGDVASGLNQISVAFGSAAIAASAMHRLLLD
jgi:thioredoxin reductase (NADPH)